MGVLFKFQRSATVIAKTNSTMVVVTKQKLDEILSSHPTIRELVDHFSNNKETWWKKQQYVLSQEKFGAEFSKDIVREDLKKLRIFSSAPDSFLDSLSCLVKCIAFEPGENIVTIGEDSNSIYFILSGAVEVIGTGGVVHAEILDGSFFGEVGVLLNIKRTASIRAKEQSFIFELEKTDVEKVLSDYPSVTGVLKTEAEARYDLFKQRTVQKPEGGSDFPDQFDMEVTFQSLSQLSIFEGVQASVLSELAMKMIRKNWSAKEFIIKCGELGESMFFLAAGDVIVLTDFGDVLETVSGPSAYFGEVAILEQVPRTASVQCVTTCSTYELRKEDFMAVMVKYKEIGERIKNTADERMQNYLMRSVLA
ncbi:cyclic nucleotide-binding-like protein [Chytriomyces sp. MP71]|nr:cyclic nucleotide-binding-like protein [Chytriomyces sp. MP71]